VKDSDYLLADGFAYVVFIDNDNEEFTVQACLREREECKDEQRRYSMTKNGISLYKREISESDAGMDQGLCADANAKCFSKYGEPECYKQFKREMKKIGIRFVS
jgi:hypothetical protein